MKSVQISLLIITYLVVAVGGVDVSSQNHLRKNDWWAKAKTVFMWKKEKVEKIKPLGEDDHVPCPDIDATADEFDLHSTFTELNLKLKDLGEVNTLRFVSDSDMHTSSYSDHKSVGRSINVGVSVPIKAIKVGAGFGFSDKRSSGLQSSSSSASFTKSFKYVTREAINTKHMPFFQKLKKQLMQHLKDEDLTTFFNDYGTKFICKITAGGRIQLKMKSKTAGTCSSKAFEESINANLNAGLVGTGDFGPKVEIGGGVSTETKSNSCFGTSGDNLELSVDGGDSIIQSIDDLQNHKGHWMDAVKKRPVALDVTYCRVDKLLSKRRFQNIVSQKLHEYLQACGGQQCSNNGKCAQDIYTGSRKCDCNPGFYGKHCSYACSSIRKPHKFSTKWVDPFKLPRKEELEPQDVVYADDKYHCLSTQMSKDNIDQTEENDYKIADKYCQQQRVSPYGTQTYDKAINVETDYADFDVGGKNIPPGERRREYYCPPKRIFDGSIVQDIRVDYKSQQHQENYGKYIHDCVLGCHTSAQKRLTYHDFAYWARDWGKVKIFRSITCAVNACSTEQVDKKSKKKKNMVITARLHTGDFKVDAHMTVQMKIFGKSQYGGKVESNWLKYDEELIPNQVNFLTEKTVTPYMKSIKSIQFKASNHNDWEQSNWEFLRLQLNHLNAKKAYLCKKAVKTNCEEGSWVKEKTFSVKCSLDYNAM
jgi:hypothetical protein